MRDVTWIQRVAVCFALVGMCMPHLAFSATPSRGKKPVIIDVALQDGGVLIGQVVNAQGMAMASVPVSLQTAGKELGVGKTDASGYFAFRGLRSDVYQVVAAKGHGAFRVWTRDIAPPASQPGALIVAGTETVRGQGGMRAFRNAFSNPWIVAGIIGVAVAIPVALHNQDQDNGKGSP